MRGGLPRWRPAEIIPQLLAIHGDAPKHLLNHEAYTLVLDDRDSVCGHAQLGHDVEEAGVVYHVEGRREVDLEQEQVAVGQLGVLNDAPQAVVEVWGPGRAAPAARGGRVALAV
ncbi:hypothetical protein WJX72_011369 [[Myrmecia] bisecta]|uniref:Uncharacterized protein n=1 Tax=[Myrmecia] bisecta TaxID=41462 RepID=A0AAW1PPD4_9CHLO